jgi:hypothetical protein
VRRAEDRPWQSNPVNSRCNRAQPTAVSRQRIPHDQQRLVQVTQQGLQKVHDLFLLDGPGIDAKVKVPQGETGSYRQTLPIKVVLQEGGLPARRPSAATMRSLTQSAFVEEDEDTPFAARFFLVPARPSSSN